MDDQATEERPEARRRGRFGRWRGAGLALVVLLAGLAAVLASGRPLPAPGWLVERIEARANAALAGQGRIGLAGADLAVGEDFQPRLRLRGLAYAAESGRRVAELPELRVRLNREALLRGRIEPRTLEITGASVALRREADGGFDLAFGAAPGAGGEAIAAESFAALLDAVDRVFETPALAGIGRIEARDLAIRLDDARARQTWHISHGALDLTQDAREVAIGVSFQLAGEGGRPASVLLSFASEKGSPAARFGASVAGVRAADLAAQAPALGWLSLLDAPISGSLRSSIDAAGAVGALDGMLEVGAGALRPAGAAKPVRFERAKLTFAYDPARARISFGELSVDGPSLRVRADAKAWLHGLETGFPEALTGQVRIADLKADPEGLFADPVSFSQGAADFKLTLAPFRVQVGQLTLIEAGRRLGAAGEIAADPAGWNVAMDFAVDAIAHDRLLALWPVGLVPKTRDWIRENVLTGELFDVKAALRLRPGAEPILSLGYEFRGAEVRIVRTLPPVQDGAGYATIEGDTHTLVVDRGHIEAPQGGEVDVAGSVMLVPDITLKPPPAIVTLRTESDIAAALSILDEPPFGLLGKAGLPVDVAEGRAMAETVLRLPLAEKLRVEDVDYDVAGTLTGVVSDRIVEGRELRAGSLELRATRAGMTLSGPGTLSGVAFDAAWSQQFGPEHRGQSRVEGTLELSPRFLDAFGIGLPKGAVSGGGLAEIALELTKGAPTRFRLTSDLNRIGLSIPEIGWSKPAARTGRLEVSGTLGTPETPARVEALTLDAPGLTAEGSVSLRAGGGLDVARLTRVRLGDWFEGPVDIAGRGNGAVALSVRGGRADMRRAAFGSASGGGSGAPVTVALDRLTVSGTLALTGFRGEFTSRGGFGGPFTGRVNGGPPVSGVVAPGAGGRSAFRIRAEDAGAVLRAAGIFSRGRIGTLDLSLRPVGGRGTYEGGVQIKGIRVKDAPVLADLLSAVSIIGMLEQLSGDGILFTETQGTFLLTPEALELRHGSAVGPSLGITLTGLYFFAGERINMQGTISPLYLVNSIGQVVSGRGEGLLAFNYRLSGTAAAPRVTANPLSILTPGMFRDIFRRPPPRLSQ